jgi:hypothetical protein
MFLVMPWMLRKGINFPITLAAGITLTVFLYVLMIRILAKFGMSL